MQTISRREFGRIAATAFTAQAAFGGPAAKIGGVTVGVQSFCFRSKPLDEAIAAMREIGLGSCELWQGHIELARANKKMPIQQWRATVPLDEYAKVREKFVAAGIELTSYNMSLQENFPDEVIARAFEMAKALGVGVVTCTSTVSAAERLYQFAKAAKIVLAMHNHAKMDPNEITRPGDFDRMTEGRSPWIGINLDIGSLKAAGFDPLSFIETHHAQIPCIHLKDWSKDKGQVVLGEGEVPVREILQTIRKNKWDIVVNIEYEKRDPDTVPPVRQCFEFCRKALS
jgi:sugar phosphate isomerase/epimerase